MNKKVEELVERRAEALRKAYMRDYALDKGRVVYGKIGKLKIVLSFLRFGNGNPERFSRKCIKDQTQRSSFCCNLRNFIGFIYSCVCFPNRPLAFDSCIPVNPNFYCACNIYTETFKHDAPKRKYPDSSHQCGFFYRNKPKDKAATKTIHPHVSQRETPNKPTPAGTMQETSGGATGMNIFVIAYDRPLGILRGDAEFLDVIRGLGPRSLRPMDRTWLVGTNLSVEAITQCLEPYLRGQGDRLLVIQLHNYYGLLPNEAWEWINQVATEYYPSG